MQIDLVKASDLNMPLYLLNYETGYETRTIINIA